ncbi:MAG: endonuclease MutS2 [Proteobacteria bacterium]|nr:endonuclease MutS2 [Pseudomonadota bacterium]
MSISAKTLDDLGWSRLVEHVCRRTRTACGEAAARSLAFFDQLEPAARRIADIAEARQLVAMEAALPFGGIKDIVTAIGRAEKGGVLESADLIAVADTGRGLGRLKKHLVDHAEDAPGLGEIAAGIADLRHMYQPIADSFESDGQLADHASDALGPLRRKLAQLKNQLERRMRSVVEDSRYNRHLQDRYYTMREDRYVIPVRVEARSAVRGIVHGTSQSGQTVFIEPDEIVELNNRVKLAEYEVADEEQRILAELSALVAADAEPLRAGVAAAADLDLIAAAAALADDLDAARPVIDESHRLHLEQARHPLMVLSERECVANDIVLEPRSLLILSGPNAGGKTVALKTAGLAALMVRAGLHIAAASGSAVPWFTSVHSDIGDSQSIENDLSTFSAHLVKLRHYLDGADQGTLLLIDEIAVGTEPEQGAALAQAVLEALVARNVPAIVTTHYERLKALGARSNQFANASVGFDLQTMAPTFRLHLGVPGSSGALAVARRMGLPGSVVDRAESLLGERRASIEELLAEVSDERRKLSEERAEVAELHQQAEVARKQAEVARESAREYERRLKHGAHSEAVAALRRARAELDEVRSAARQFVRQGELGQLDKKVSRLARTIVKHETPKPQPDGKVATEATIESGTRVYVTSLGQSGEVTGSPDRGKVTVQIGTMRTAVPLSDLVVERTHNRPTATGKAKASAALGRKAGKKPRQPRGRRDGDPAGDGSSGQSGGDRTIVRTPDVTIDVRGERADEAVTSVDRFIDQCLLAMRDVVFVIHGHGTGALRSAIRSHFESHHAVSDWRAGERSEGGDGVTVAWLDLS